MAQADREFRAITGRGGRLLSRALLVALALVSLLGPCGRSHGQASATPASGPASGGGPADGLQRRRDDLLRWNQDLQQRLERSRRCLQGANSLDGLERCREASRWQGGVDGRRGPWPGCPMW